MKINAILCGIASVFSGSSGVDIANIFKEYPTTYEKNAKEALRNSWITVGKEIKGAIYKYEEENKTNSESK